MAANESPQTAAKQRTVKVLMFTVTESLAASLFNWSQIVLAVGAAAVLIGTIGAFAMGFAKEQFVNERIVLNEAETARAKADAAQATARAEEARLETEKLKAPRGLSSEQRRLLVEALKSAPKGRVVVKPNFQDMEATQFAKQISSAFNEAGFSGVGDAPLEIISTERAGIVIAIRDGNAAPPHIKAIIDAFAKAAIPVTEVGQTPLVPENVVVILVGRKF
jgi:hypothetical protein